MTEIMRVLPVFFLLSCSLLPRNALEDVLATPPNADCVILNEATATKRQRNELAENELKMSLVA